MGAYPNPTAGDRGYFNPGTGGAGSNQYFGSMPFMPNSYSGSYGSSGGYSGAIPGYNSGSATAGYGSGANYKGGGLSLINQQYPGLGNNFANMLNSQIGKGLPGFEDSVQLPTGGWSQPGQLTADMNPLLAQLAHYFQTGQGGSMPGMNTLSDIANNGVSALPEWQSMIAAMGQNTAQNQAQLKEQFAGMGDLAGSPFGTAMSNYMQRTNLDQNALLGQLQQSNIQNIQMPAIAELFQGSQAMAGGLQSLDQSAISNAYQQFQTDLPQNNPFLQYMAMFGSLYPPTGQSQSGASEAGAIMGGIGELAQGAGSIMAACPAEGSLILMMDESEKPVEQLVKGDAIQGVDGEPCIVDLVPKVYEDVIGVHTADGLYCRNSLSHTFVLPRGGFAVASKSFGCKISTVNGPSEVDSIEYAGKAFVYDILTDGSHTYRADGVWAQGGEVVNGMVVTEDQVATYR